MRHAKDVRVERAIVHAIDHVDKESATTSELEIDLAAQPRVREYFEGQVLQAVSTSTAYAARFETPDESAAAACYRLLGRRPKLVETSQHLAERLFAATSGNRSIAVGSLLVCRYTTPTFPGSDFLALIKIDLTDALIQEVTTDEEGHRAVTFRIEERALPSLGSQLHKAVIVCPREHRPVTDEGETYDLLLLDRQTRGEPARFFKDDFLRARSCLDDAQRTKKLWSAMLAAEKELKYILEPDEVAQFAARREQVFLDARVDVPKFVTNTRFSRDQQRDQSAREKTREILDQRVLDQQFQPDSQVVDSLISKVRFVGDYGIDVSFFKLQKDAIFRQVREVRQGGRKITYVELRVPNLRWAKS